MKISSVSEIVHDQIWDQIEISGSDAISLFWQTFGYLSDYGTITLPCLPLLTDLPPNIIPLSQSSNIITYQFMPVPEDLLVYIYDPDHTQIWKNQTYRNYQVITDHLPSYGYLISINPDIQWHPFHLRNLVMMHYQHLSSAIIHCQGQAPQEGLICLHGITWPLDYSQEIEVYGKKTVKIPTLTAIKKWN